MTFTVHNSKKKGSNVQAIAEFTAQSIWSRLLRPFFLVNIELDQASAPPRYATIESPIDAKH